MEISEEFKESMCKKYGKNLAVISLEVLTQIIMLKKMERFMCDEELAYIGSCLADSLAAHMVQADIGPESQPACLACIKEIRHYLMNLKKDTDRAKEMADAVVAHQMSGG